MSVGWLSRVAQGGIEIAGYATALDRIGRRDPGELTYLDDVGKYEYWDGTAWQRLATGTPAVTAPLTLTSTAPTMVPLTLVGAAGQTATLLQVGGSVTTPDTVLSTADSYAIKADGNPVTFDAPGVANAFLWAGGVLNLQGGTKLNVSYGAPSWGGGTGSMIFVGNDGSDPSTNPVGGGILYCSGGALKYRGPSGTVTTVAPA